MTITAVCNAPYREGGLGQHFAQVVEEARSQGILERYYTSAIKPGDTAGREVVLRSVPWICQHTPVRISPGWKSWVGFELFDRAVAARLEPGHVLNAFVGQALLTFRRARKLGYEVLELVAANSHVRNVQRQHERAIQQYGLEGSWLNEAQARKTIKEYSEADIIYANSEYTRQSLIAEGTPESKVSRREFKPDPRFAPPATRPCDGVLRVVYVGSLTVPKGIPVLIEAFSRLAVREAELTLVGGYTTRAMRKYIESWLARDPRIRLAPGDPLAHLQRASVCVHPAYEDGFAYSGAEALACGTPVIVTEDTGMKELVREGLNGYIVPTGSWEAILERLEHLQRHPMFSSKV